MSTVKVDNIQHRNVNTSSVRLASDGSVSLYNGNNEKLKAVSGGCDVTGDLNVTGKIGKDAGDYVEFTTDTQLDLFINGSNEFRFEADGDFHADGDVIAFSTTVASDRKLKNNIETIKDPIAKINALRGVSFEWKRDNTKSAGVIAQDVEKVLPQAVKEVIGLDDVQSYKTVNYQALTSILIEAIKELSQRIVVLENK